MWRRKAALSELPTRSIGDGASLDRRPYADAAEPQRRRQFYRKLDKTQEWAENNYYHLPIEKQNAGSGHRQRLLARLCRVRRQGPFLSTNLAEASRNFTEMMFALAVLDLPFEAAEARDRRPGRQLTLKAGSPMVVFHKEIQQAQRRRQGQDPILVSQNYFRAGRPLPLRSATSRSRQVSSPTNSSPTSSTAARWSITNPTSSRQKLDVLLQIPQGAIPVLQRPLHPRRPHRPRALLHPAIEYYFYFPQRRRFAHYPGARGQERESSSPRRRRRPSRSSISPPRSTRPRWDYISQNGTAGRGAASSRTTTSTALEPRPIAWRMKDEDFFATSLALLPPPRLQPHPLVLRHQATTCPAASANTSSTATTSSAQCGRFIDCKLLTIDPVIRKSYQHLEYCPLVNARAHQLGKRRQILNDRFAAQYRRLLDVLSYRPHAGRRRLWPSPITCCFQDRIEEAMGSSPRSTRPSCRRGCSTTTSRPTSISTPTDPRSPADRRRSTRTTRWTAGGTCSPTCVRQLDEIEGKARDGRRRGEPRRSTQARLAATEPRFDFKVEARKVTRQLPEPRRGHGELLPDGHRTAVLAATRSSRSTGGQFSYIQPERDRRAQARPAKARPARLRPARRSSTNAT